MTGIEAMKRFLKFLCNIAPINHARDLLLTPESPLGLGVVISLPQLVSFMISRLTAMSI